MQINQTIIQFCVTNNLAYDQRMQRICNSLQANGFKVELIGRSYKLSEVQKKQVAFKQTYLNCFFNKGKLFYLEYNIRLFFYLLFAKQNAICANDLDTLLAAGLVSVLKRKILVFDAHEHFTEVPELYNRKWSKQIWHALGLLWIKRAKLCYTVSSQLGILLSKTYHNHFEVIRNVPLPNKVEKNTTLQQPYILYQGALNEGRGLEQSILAMHQISGLKLLLAGEGDLSETLKKLAETEKLTNKVVFLGYKTPAELKQITANAFVGLNLLMPLGLSYYYSLANKFFDYMQAGIPCLCANFPEYKTINEQFDCAVLVNCDPNSIATEIQKLQNNKERYLQLSQNCVEASKEFNWNLEEQKLINLYKNILTN